MQIRKLWVFAAACLLGASLAWADVASVKKAIKAKFPDADQIEVTKTTYSGLYEVFADGQLFYTDENVSFFLLGNLIDTKTMANVTKERIERLTAIKFDSLPLNLAVKKVKGNGKRKLALFSDPNCPYCKRLEKDLVQVTDVTIYTFLYPIIRPQLEDQSKGVWCAQDRVKAWDDLVLKGVQPEGGNCDTPIEDIKQLGHKHKIDSVPAMVFADGRVVKGAIPTAQLEKYLNGQ